MTRDRDGCGIIRLTKENLVELTEKINEFELKVTFSEEGTGTKDEARWKGSLKDEPVKLDLIGSNRISTGGLPYSAEISVQNYDGTPIKNETINVCVALYKVRRYALLLD